MSVNTLNCVKLALNKYSNLLTRSDISTLGSYVFSREYYDQKIESYLNEKLNDTDYALACSFIRIKQIKIEPQYIYGSHVQAEFINEISICRGREQNGQIIPNENDIIFKAMITQQALSEAIFNSDTLKGNPVTYTQFLSQNLSPYEPSFSIKKQYDVDYELKNESLAKEFYDLLREARMLQDTSVSLSKKNKEKYLELSKSISRKLSSDPNYDLELIVERLEKDLQHVRSEFISTLSGYIQKVAQDVPKLACSEEEQDTLIHNFFNYTFENKRKAHLHNAIKIVLDNESLDSEDYKQLSKKASKYLTEYQNDRFANADLNKGTITISKTSGSPHFLFGESKSVHNYISLNFNFSYDKVNDDAQYDILNMINIMKISMSNVQFIELLQSGLSDHWVKCTPERFLMQPVPFPNKEESRSHDSFKAERIKLSDLTQQLIVKFNTIIKLAESTSKSKRHRESLLSELSGLDKLIQKAIKKDDQIIKDASKNVLEKMKEKTNKDFMETLNKVSEYHSIPSNIFKALELK